jgi:hypothetical protein
VLPRRFVLELEGNETPTSMCLVSFAGAHDSSELLAVGTAVDMVLMPLQCEKGCIHVYRWADGARLGPEANELLLLERCCMDSAWCVLLRALCCML